MSGAQQDYHGHGQYGGGHADIRSHGQRYEKSSRPHTYGVPNQVLTHSSAAAEYKDPGKVSKHRIFENAAQSMVCPITHCPMSEPVMDKEGYTYEKAAIMQWLQNHTTSPVTRNPMRVEDLTPNRALASAIESMSLASSAPLQPPYVKQQHIGPEYDDVAQSQPSSLPRSRADPVSVSAYAISSDQVPELGDDIVVHVKLRPPVAPLSGTRPRLDLCCVIDVSGSMNAEATLKDADGNEEGDGLSILDVVRHGVKTIMQLLEPGDRLAVVKYSSTAGIVHKLTLMNDAGKALSKAKLDELTPMGTTNLWDGLKIGLDVLREDCVPGRTQCLMLLTDGVPNVEPPRGHIPMLRRYYEKNPSARDIVLGTFGFGYKLNSTLLRQIADEGDGTYSFIPDVGLVGTVFIHAAANVLAVAAKNAMVEISTPADAPPLSQANVVGGRMARSSPSGCGLALPVGSIMFEQDRDVCLRIPRACWKGLTIRAQYTDACSGDGVMTHSLQLSEFGQSTDSMFHFFRLLAEDALMRAAQDSCPQSEAKPLVRGMVDTINRSAHKAEPTIAALLQDLQGQGTEAVSREDWHGRWGRHYLLSLSSAHGLQQCNNFKDPGVQRYGGGIFSDLRDEADDQFSRLPPPVPTRDRVNADHAAKVAASRSGAAGAQAAASAAEAQRRAAAARAPVSMSRYNCASAPCFAGECAVATPQGPRPVHSLARGDVVHTPNGTAVVECVVVSKCVNNTAFFVAFPNGLQITPYHPVRVNGVWQPPQKVHHVYEVPCREVFNLVLKSQHVVIVNGVECVTLGHGFDDPGVQHSYLGTQKIVNDLKQCVGWSTGRVYVERMVRDETRNTISGLVEVSTNTVATA